MVQIILDIAFYSEPKLNSVEQLLAKHQGTWEHYLLLPQNITVYLIKFAEFEATEQRGNLRIVVVRMPAIHKTGNFVESLLSKYSPQLIITHSLKFPLRHFLLQKHVNSQCKLAVQLHADWLRKNPIVRLSQKIAYKTTNYILVTGAAQIQAMLNRKVLPKSAAVIEMMEGSRNFIPKAYSANTKTTQLIWVGRFIARKDFATLLRACHILKNKQADFFLNIVSSGGSLRDDCMNMIAELNLVNETKVHLNLNSTEMQAMYTKADIFISTSWQEGSGWALCEAMATGLAAVVSDIAPQRWMTDNGRTGGLFTCGDEHQLASLIVSSSSKKMELGKIAREVFEKKLSFQAIADTIVRLL